ncbi:ribosome biogenesis factor YjgA [Shewanella sp. 125m-7]
MKIVGDSEHFHQPYDKDENYESRADAKREIAIYQEYGNRLVALSKTQVQKLNLDETLLDNVLKAKIIKMNTEAHRRHIQYIGKLMRFVDLEELDVAIKNVLNQNSNESAKTNVADKARDQLLTEGDSAVQALIEQYPEFDRQKLRQYIRQTKKELTKNPDIEASKTAKELSKYIRNEIKD